jgi:transcriptional regulator with XRE-family HTH domain
MTVYGTVCGEGNSCVECLLVKQSAGSEWSVNWTRVIGENVRSIRKARKLSTQSLSDICSERVGYAVPRNTIVNLETGRKESLSVQELVVIALALDTPPVVLLYPLDQDVEIAPGEPRNPFHAVEWFAGKWSAGEASELTDSGHPAADQLRVLRDYVEWASKARYWARVRDVAATDPSQAAAPLEAAQGALDRALTLMSAHRDRLLREGIQAPELPGLDAVEWRQSPLTIERNDE